MVRIYLAGRVQIEAGQRVVTEHDLPGRQGRLMLTRLALTRSPVAHDQLGDLFWEEDRPPAWQATLSPLASRLRSAFAAVGAGDGAAIVSRSGAYELRLQPRWVDVEVAIRSLDRAEGHLTRGNVGEAWTDAAVASAIFRRPFLQGEGHPWVTGWRATLDDGLVRSLLVLGEASLRRQDWTQAETMATECIRREPLREVAHRQRIRAIAGMGDRSRALRAFRELEETLAEEVGGIPSAETVDLYERLLSSPA